MSSFATIKVWLIACRPKTLWASIVPVAVGGALAHSNGRVSLITFSAILVCALLIQIATNFANDVFDFEKGADDENRTGPLRVTQAGLVTPTEMRRALWGTLALALLVGIYLVYLGGVPILLIGVLSLACAILYTAGPWPLAYIGMGDIFVFLFFGPIAVSGTQFLLNERFEPAALIAGLGTGAISTAVLVVNNLRDIEGDSKTGKNTLAVRFGRLFALSEYFCLIVIACSVPLALMLYNKTTYWMLTTCFLLLPGIWLTRKLACATDGRQFNTTLERTGQFLAVYGLFLTIGLLL